MNSPATSQSLTQFREWLNSQGIPEDVAKPRRAGFFIEEDGSIESLNKRWLAGEEVSWLGGPAPLEGAWPVNADGKPLAHVATLSLHVEFDKELDFDDLDVGETIDGSPRSGYLTVFHDLEAYGATWDDPSSWLAKWYTVYDIPSQRFPLVSPPAEVDTPTEVFQMGRFVPGYSIVSPDDVHGEIFERYELAYQEYLRQWQKLRKPNQGPPLRDDYPVPLTALYAHSYAGFDTANNELLPEVLPKDIDNEFNYYVCLAQIESWTTLTEWFGDASPLEVWIAFADLGLGDLHKNWCLTRTEA